MDIEEFAKNSHLLVDWIVNYFKNIEKFPVKSQVKPGDIINQIPQQAPEQGESFREILQDLDTIIMPGITHWQSPNFFAYFNANNSFPSLLAEMITAAIGAQCMSWQTSPSATELEERVMQWTAELIHLPPDFYGVIHDTASTATLCSILTAREKYSDFKINQRGFYINQKFTAYCSSEAHSSIDKAIKIAGIGSGNLRKIPVDENFALLPDELEKEIILDKQRGYKPLIVVAALGTTGCTAVDPLDKISSICKRHNLWLHVDAAYAGTALLLEENCWMLKGIENADTFVFNPHKWMFTNFDCSAYFVRDKEALLNTFSILPEYLKTKEGKEVYNYRDWGIQLGRRFRALKLWFVLRTYGSKDLRKKIRLHCTWAQELKEKIEKSAVFELLAPVHFATVCFRFKPENINDREHLNELNKQLLENLNSTGKIYLTHTKLNDIFTLRFVIGQTYQEKRHIMNAWKLIGETAGVLSH